MSIRYNSVKLASANTYHPDLFDVKWSDHILDNISWLRADTFSWHYGELYTRAYQHLTKDIANKILQSETVAGITIQYYLANDGHKICPDTEEENVQDLYEETGIAWYYIIDTTNHRFKLPRTKYAFTGVRDNVGKYVEAGAPNITGLATSTYIWTNGSASGAFSYENGIPIGATGSDRTSKNIKFNASDSNSIYGNSTTIQPQATEMYLYFYIGNFAQEDITNTYGPEFMAHQAMPSDRYVDLTLGASESTYIAPADGYMFVRISETAVNQYLRISVFNNNTHCLYKTQKSPTSTGYIADYLPVSEGDTVRIEYTLGGDSQLKFFYANGSK